MFEGFPFPEENWSKLPHELIEQLPQIKSLAELKVILYVLRHTWGYQDDWKRITIDEFVHGRKHKDGSRIDNGTGMSEQSIKSGIKQAVEHGFLIIDIDDSDKGRIRKYYCLNAQGVKSLPPERKKLTPRGRKVNPRTEKETNREKLKKEKEATPPPPAVETYRSVAKRFPDSATWPDIANTVGEEPDNLAFWENVVRQYIGCGWNKLNIVGMLEFYRKRILPSTKPQERTNGRQPSNGATPAATNKDAEAIRAALEKRSRRNRAAQGENDNSGYAPVR